jgi:hypothetical protein
VPSKSQAQQGAAGAALAAKRGETAASKLYGASAEMYKDMSAGQLRHFAKTKRQGLPPHKSLVGMNTQGTTSSCGYPSPKACLNVEAIVNHLLDEEDEEQAEVSSAQTILAALSRLQSSLPNPTPEQQHDLTTIRAAARSLVRMHGVA